MSPSTIGWTAKLCSQISIKGIPFESHIALYLSLKDYGVNVGITVIA